MSYSMRIMIVKYGNVQIVDIQKYTQNKSKQGNNSPVMALWRMPSDDDSQNYIYRKG
jgi:hypothetical protein